MGGPTFKASDIAKQYQIYVKRRSCAENNFFFQEFSSAATFETLEAYGVVKMTAPYLVYPYNTRLSHISFKAVSLL